MNLLNTLLRLPKSELHFHLNGAMPISVFTHLLNKHNPVKLMANANERHLKMFQSRPNIIPFLADRKWEEEEVRALFRYQSFDDFLVTYCFSSYFVRDTEDMAEVIIGVLTSLRAQNVVYVEITMSVIEHLWNGLTLPELKECMESVNLPGIRVNWIVDLVRDIGPETTLALLRDILALDCERIVGITIGGAEHYFPPAQFAEVYKLARVNGLRLSAHAGEGLGAESVWDALRILHAERIGHGVRAVEDPELVRYLAEHRIPLEVCPTSNLRTGIYQTYQEHPAHKLYAAGIPITINSDDPTFFFTTITDEYQRLPEMGFTPHEIYEVLANGFRCAFLPDSDKVRYLAELEREWQKVRVDEDSK